MEQNLEAENLVLSLVRKAYGLALVLGWLNVIMLEEVVEGPRMLIPVGMNGTEVLEILVSTALH